MHNCALQTGRTALMVASHDGHDKVVNELLQANADVNLCDKVCFSYINTVYESILAALYIVIYSGIQTVMCLQIQNLMWLLFRKK